MALALLQDSTLVDDLVFTENSCLLQPRGALTEAINNLQVSTNQRMISGKVLVDRSKYQSSLDTNVDTGVRFITASCYAPPLPLLSRCQVTQ